MRDYSVTLVAVSALSCAVAMLLRGTGPEKYAKVAMGFVLLYAAVSPLPELIENAALSIENFDAPDYDDAFGDTLEESMALGIEAALGEKFGLEGNDISVRLSGVTREPLGAEHIYVILSGDALTADHRRIKAFVDEMGLGECEVRFDFG